jgi:tryptophan-rich sensory protein
MKANYILIPLFTILVSGIGSVITGRGMGWYRKIKLPGFTPPGSIIGGVWTTIFVLATISALFFWNHIEKSQIFWLVATLFVLNGILNVFWSYLFFGRHLLYVAIFEAGILGLSVLGLIVFLYPIAFLASLLLWPYFLWVCFATFLTYKVWSLNK